MQYESDGRYSVNGVLKEIVRDRFASNNNRYVSWEDCHTAFINVLKKGFEKSDSELLALNLVGYLASWGMYRGSSDLLKEYKYFIHKGLIEILFQDKYLTLFNIDENEFKNNISNINEVYKEIEGYYNKLSTKGKQFKASETLITKIMLGVYACVPAYDRNLMKGLRYYDIQKSGNKKFGSLQKWLEDNPIFVAELLSFGDENFAKRNVYYPYMKLVDMYFCNLNFKENEKK